MSPEEALAVLHLIKVVLLDMGLTAQAGETEHVELILGTATNWHPRVELARIAHELAASVLPPGKRGRIHLVLRRPAEARAIAVTAAVLRAVE